MPHTTDMLDTHDEAPVVVHRWEPEVEVRGVVNLVHGMAEHAARYDHVATALNEAGFEVQAVDLRGHGASARSEEDLGFIAERRGWATLLDDVHRLTSRIRAERPDLPVVILGHSMGSFLVQQYLSTFPDEIDGAVLSASTGPQGPITEAAALVARAERLRLGRRGRSKLLNELVFGAYNKPFEPARTDFDWLSRDAEQVDRYIADPRCGWVGTAQFYLDLFSGVRVIQQAHRLRNLRRDLPVYVFAGTDDPLGGSDGIAKLLAWYERTGMTDVEHRLYEGARHETLNEVDRDEVIADLIDWLERHTGG